VLPPAHSAGHFPVSSNPYVNRVEHQIWKLELTLAERLVDDFLMENSMATGVGRVWSALST
jgi:hypothetical protein